MMIAIAVAVSAAAIAMAKSVNTIPSIEPGNRNLLNITKFRSAEFNTSSSEINRAIIFLRVTNPYTPATNIMMLGMRYHNMLKSIIAYLLRAMVTPPIIHARRRILIASKGSRYWKRSVPVKAVPISCIVI